MFWFGFAAGAVIIGAVVWYGKDKIQSILIGAEATAAALRSKADAIAATIKKV